MGATLGISLQSNMLTRAESLGLLRAWFPDRSALQPVAELVAASIKRAHRAAPASWEFTHRPTYARLNVGQIAVLDLFPGQLAIYGVYSAARGGRGIERQLDWPGYVAVGGRKARWWVDAARAATLPRALVQANHKLIDAAAAAKRRSPFKAYHEPKAIEAIAGLAGVVLPQPGYHVPNPPNHSAARRGGLFGDPESNAAVEQAAIGQVTKHYEKAGWHWKSKERDRDGYDLRCWRGQVERHVEVKGRSSSEITFILTEHELEVADTDRNFQLAVVTEALSRMPRLHFYNGAEFRRLFKVTPQRYVARIDKPGAARKARDPSNRGNRNNRS